MRVLSLALCATAVLGAVDFTRLVNDEELINSINSKQSTWVAAPSSRFEGMTLADAAKLMGTIRTGPRKMKARQALGKWDLKALPASAIPTGFDSRTAWPACANVTGHVRDQSACGSCWAFGSTESFNDRMCIAHNYTGLLSPADTNACCNFMNGCMGSSGCDGGIPDEAWTYFTQVGVVTGGDYDELNTGDSCYPYPFPFCSHHEQGKYPMCPENEYSTPACPSSCPDGKYNGNSWSNDKHMAQSAYNLNSVSDIQTDIMTRGPVTAAFDVYADFLTYKSGVYQQQSQDYLGGHAIEIVGWGVWTDGTPYWTVKNSWNQYWGDNGFFLILRGQDECGIEDDVVSGAV